MSPVRSVVLLLSGGAYSPIPSIKSSAMNTCLHVCMCAGGVLAQYPSEQGVHLFASMLEEKVPAGHGEQVVPSEMVPCNHPCECVYMCTLTVCVRAYARACMRAGGQAGGCASGWGASRHECVSLSFPTCVHTYVCKWGASTCMCMRACARECTCAHTCVSVCKRVCLQVCKRTDTHAHGGRSRTKLLGQGIYRVTPRVCVENREFHALRYAFFSQPLADSPEVCGLVASTAFLKGHHLLDLGVRYLIPEGAIS